MEKLLTYLNSLNKEERLLFCAASGISEGHMRKIISTKQGFKPILCVAIERASKSEITRKHLRPDDWRLIWPELLPKHRTTAETI